MVALTMTSDRHVLAQLRNSSGPLPLSALFAGTDVRTREEVQLVIEGLLRSGEIEPSLGTDRMPFYRLAAEGTTAMAQRRRANASRDGHRDGS